MEAQLSGLDVIRVLVVLQDCADQLAVLGHIMPKSYQGLEAETMVSGNIDPVLEQQKAAELHLKAVRERQLERAAVSEAVHELHRSQLDIQHSLSDGLLSSDYISKVERDRQFVTNVINMVLVELKEKGTFTSLLQAVSEEKKKKAELQEIIMREEEGRLRIKPLQKQIIDIQKEMALEIQKREEIAAQLKDQLQYTKLKTKQKNSYVKQSSELLVYQGRKLNDHQKSQLEEEIWMLKEKLQEEKRVHKEIEEFLNKHQLNLQEKLEYWIERYDEDTQDKQQEIKNLKTNKANTLEELSELIDEFKECEQVIIEDRLEKENLRKQQEREQLEKNSATRIQAWWRGTMVRKGLGAFKKTKKGKSKKGKKKKK